MHTVKWGIIGCGDVTEVKSGPAFNKVNNSAVVAVMRRDAEKARDYAQRHNIATWYNNAASLINDPAVNAVYIATPPSSHEEYTLAALEAGKPVYLEKPMAMNYASAKKMEQVSQQNGVKLVVAHYRRAQPFFKAIKNLVAEKAIGDTRFVKIELYKKALTKEELTVSKNAWRVDPVVAGGGLFHDLAPHQLDLATYFFGDAEKAHGYSFNQAGLYPADDITAGCIKFRSGILLTGIWCFNAAEQDEKDSFEIIGSAGSMRFSTFGDHVVSITNNNKTEVMSFDIPAHVQQPMIEKVVEYFLGQGSNPCTAEDGAAVMWMIDQFTGNG